MMHQLLYNVTTMLRYAIMAYTETYTLTRSDCYLEVGLTIPLEDNPKQHTEPSRMYISSHHLEVGLTVQLVKCEMKLEDSPRTKHKTIKGLHFCTSSRSGLNRSTRYIWNET